MSANDVYVWQKWLEYFFYFDFSDYKLLYILYSIRKKNQVFNFQILKTEAKDN